MASHTFSNPNNDLHKAYAMTVERIARHNERTDPKRHKPTPTYEEFCNNYAEALSEYIVAGISLKAAPSRQYAAARSN